MHVLLAEPAYRSRYPPLGLLKLASYHRLKGDTVELARGCIGPKQKPSLIYITSLFTWTWKPVWDAVRYYKSLFPEAELWLGGLYARARNGSNGGRPDGYTASSAFEVGRLHLATGTLAVIFSPRKTYNLSPAYGGLRW